MIRVPAGVERDLREPGLTRLFAEARRRFEARGGATGSVTLTSLRPDEALAIDSLWKPSARRRPRRGRDFRCQLRDLDESLVSTFGLSLEEALLRTGAPLRLGPQERERERQRDRAFWEEMHANPLCDQEPRVHEWVERLRSTGALGSRPFATARGRSLAQSFAVGRTLPRRPPIERSTLASEILSDPHALDDDTPVGERLVSQLAAREAVPPRTHLTAGERRALLSRFGVLCDPASATVLTLGLRPVGDSALEQSLRLLAGGHVVLTLGQLSRTPLQFAHGQTIRLCENPTVVVRAEARLGVAAAPLVCTGGWPGSAVCALLDTLREADARLEHHGDFDWDGVAIARWLRAHYDAQPWRFDAHAYRLALGVNHGQFAALGAPRHRHPSDDELVQTLHRYGVAVPEEATLDRLVNDLDCSPRR